MARFKALVRFQRNDGFYPAYIRIAHKDKSGFIKTDKVVGAKGVGKNKSVKVSTRRLKYNKIQRKARTGKPVCALYINNV